MKLEVGVKAPNIELLNQYGETVSLGDYAGRKLLVYFYPKADTPGCTKQSCAVNDALGNLQKAGVDAVGISPDTPDKQKKFADKYGLTFPLLADEDHAVAEAFGVWGERSMYGKKYMGIERSAFLIDEKGMLEGVWYKVSPADTVPFVKTAIGID
jgi:peroxiredoxin Q/BCP